MPCLLVLTLAIFNLMALDAVAKTRAVNAPLPGGQQSVGQLPRMLNAADIKRYREIFKLQAKGRWPQADRRIRKLENKLLLGHVLEQRYMHPRKYRSRYRELRTWLNKYADHPDAYRLYRLANKRRPRKATRPRPPLAPTLAPQFAHKPTLPRARGPAKRAPKMGRKGRYLDTIVRRNAYRGRPTRAIKILARRDARKYIPRARYDYLRATVARAYFHESLDKKAYALAAKATRSRNEQFSADWIAGLAAWRMGQFSRAAVHFGHVSRAPTADRWNRAAGAFWAARSHLVAGNSAPVINYLQQAASHPHTFYGLIALRLLGDPVPFDFRAPQLEATQANLLLQTTAVRRAIALARVGQFGRADAEIVHAQATASIAGQKALLALAYRLQLPRAQFKITSRRVDRNFVGYDAGRFPLPPWRPAQGFAIDPALLFAFMRQESGFRPKAKSRAGARGLMQLMPRTAGFIAGDRRLQRGGRNRLFDPVLNISLGQKYLQHLMGLPMISGDLIRLMAAYNAGPGNLKKWLRRTKYNNDPLLFVECITARETRIFVEKVMANYWIYQQRLGRRSTSLDALAAGIWPAYKQPPKHHLAQGGQQFGGKYARK